MKNSWLMGFLGAGTGLGLSLMACAPQANDGGGSSAGGHAAGGRSSTNTPQSTGGTANSVGGGGTQGPSSGGGSGGEKPVTRAGGGGTGGAVGTGGGGHFSGMGGSLGGAGGALPGAGGSLIGSGGTINGSGGASHGAGGSFTGAGGSLSGTGGTAPVSEVWSDRTTGLNWTRAAQTDLNWHDAADHCDSLTLGGKTGWRLPTIAELRSLVVDCIDTEADSSTCRIDDNCLDKDSCWDESCKGCWASASSCTHPGTLAGDCGAYWSSDEDDGAPGEIWSVVFSSAAVDTVYQTEYANVRCVR